MTRRISPIKHYNRAAQPFRTLNKRSIARYYSKIPKENQHTPWDTHYLVRVLQHIWIVYNKKTTLFYEVSHCDNNGLPVTGFPPFLVPWHLLVFDRRVRLSTTTSK